MTQGLLVMLWHYLCQLLLCQLLMSFLILPLFTCPCAWISCLTIFYSAMGQSSFIDRSVRTTHIHSVQKDLPHYFCILFLSSLPISLIFLSFPLSIFSTLFSSLFLSPLLSSFILVQDLLGIYCSITNFYIYLLLIVWSWLVTAEWFLVWSYFGMNCVGEDVLALNCG